MRITLVRHAETLANAAHIWQGQTDAALSPLGETQREHLTARMRGQRFDVVLCSDLGRTRRTAEALGVVAEPLAAWREANVGSWEGRTQAEIARLFPEEVKLLLDGEDFRIGQTGESFGEFQNRVAEAFNGVVQTLRPTNGHAVVVTHGGVISTLLLHLMGKKKRLGTRTMAMLRNTSLTTVAFDDHQKPHIAVFNDATHLGTTAGSSPFARVAMLHANDDAQALEHLDSAQLFTTFGAARHTIAAHPASISSLASRLLRCQDEHAAFAPPNHGAASHFEIVEGAVSLLDHGVVPRDSANHAST
ncbi:MAG: histidine phosphatase family protein [Sandaracinaceae bacterium]|nr:histidine phosphatase family protein [Sandaracinaceae bacterium]